MTGFILLNRLVNGVLYLAYALVAAAVLSMLVFFVLHLIRQSRKERKALIFLGILLAVFGVGYLAAPNLVLPVFGKIQIYGRESKLIDAGFFTLYGLIIVSVILALYTEVSKYFK